MKTIIAKSGEKEDKQAGRGKVFWLRLCEVSRMEVLSSLGGSASASGRQTRDEGLESLLGLVHLWAYVNGLQNIENSQTITI